MLEVSVFEHPKSIAAILVVQVACGVFLIGKIFLSEAGGVMTLGDWIEILSAFGLFLGVFLGAILLRDSLERSERAEVRLRQEGINRWGHGEHGV